MATWTVARDSLRNLSQYLAAQGGDDVLAALRCFPQQLLRSERYTDDFTLFSFASISTTKQSVDTDAGAHPLVVVVRSNGTTSYVQFYNAAAASVTEGVNADFLVPCSSTANEPTVLACLGASWKRFWATGLVVSASSTQETSSAPTNPPDLWVLATGI